MAPWTVFPPGLPGRKVTGRPALGAVPAPAERLPERSWLAMRTHNPEHIHNIALTGHAASGKKSLIEAILHRVCAIGRAGSVEEGNTVCDFEPEEKHHKHSLKTTVVNF